MLALEHLRYPCMVRPSISTTPPKRSSYLLFAISIYERQVIDAARALPAQRSQAGIASATRCQCQEPMGVCTLPSSRRASHLRTSRFASEQDQAHQQSCVSTPSLACICQVPSRTYRLLYQLDYYQVCTPTTLGMDGRPGWQVLTVPSYLRASPEQRPPPASDAYKTTSRAAIHYRPHLCPAAQM